MVKISLIIEFVIYKLKSSNDVLILIS